METQCNVTITETYKSYSNCLYDLSGFNVANYAEFAMLEYNKIVFCPNYKLLLILKAQI